MLKVVILGHPFFKSIMHASQLFVGALHDQPVLLVMIKLFSLGSFGVVYKAQLKDRNMRNPKLVAVKTVHGK